jgi:hypothetical protein
MLLLGQLLRGKLIKLDHFLRENTSSIETFSHEHDLRDKGIVRDHHCHRSEENLKVIG